MWAGSYKQSHEGLLGIPPGTAEEIQLVSPDPGVGREGSCLGFEVRFRAGAEWWDPENVPIPGGN